MAGKVNKKASAGLEVTLDCSLAAVDSCEIWRQDNTEPTWMQKQSALNCWIAALLYLATFCISAQQFWMHNGAAATKTIWIFPPLFLIGWRACVYIITHKCCKTLQKSWFVKFKFRKRWHLLDFGIPDYERLTCQRVCHLQGVYWRVSLIGLFAHSWCRPTHLLKNSGCKICKDKPI